MKIRIISDGTGIGTQVFNADTGEKIKDCTVIHWYIDVIHGIATADIRFYKTQVEVVGEAKGDFPPLEYQTEGGP